jgi:Protein of unknown function (DUF2550).
VDWVWGAIGSLVVVAGLILAVYLTRFRAIVTRVGSFECSLRESGSRRWREGYASYGLDRLDWFPVASLRVRPRYSWRRGDLEVERVERRVSRQTGRDVVDVEIHAAGARYHLVVVDEAYSGLRSWLESAPPTPASFQ